MIQDFLQYEQYDLIRDRDRVFITAFDEAMDKLSYENGGITNGYCWGRFMILYYKSGTKNKNIVARIYIRDQGIALRLYLNKINDHRAYIEQAPAEIKRIFIGPEARCQHCHNEKNGSCRFRKTYTIDQQLIEKCNGLTFILENPDITLLPDYLALFCEFYPVRQAR